MTAEAAAWLKAHPEWDVDGEIKGILTGLTGAQHGPEQGRNRWDRPIVNSIDDMRMGVENQNEDGTYSEATQLTEPAATPQPLDLDDLFVRAHLDHCMSFMDKRRRELLHRVAYGATEVELAEEEGVTQQAISQRLKVARAEAARLIVDHWDDIDDETLPVEELL